MSAGSTFTITGLLIAAGIYVFIIGDNFWWGLFGMWIITLGVAVYSVSFKEELKVHDPREFVPGYSCGLGCIIPGIFVIKGGYELSLGSGWWPLLIASIAGIGAMLFAIWAFIGQCHSR